MKVLVFFKDRPFAEKPELPEGGVYRNSLVLPHIPEDADFVMGDIPEMYKGYPIYEKPKPKRKAKQEASE